MGCPVRCWQQPMPSCAAAPTLGRRIARTGHAPGSPPSRRPRRSSNSSWACLSSSLVAFCARSRTCRPPNQSQRANRMPHKPLPRQCERRFLRSSEWAVFLLYISYLVHTTYADSIKPPSEIGCVSRCSPLVHRMPRRLISPTPPSLSSPLPPASLSASTQPPPPPEVECTRSPEDGGQGGGM